MEIITEMARCEWVYYSVDEMLKVFKNEIMEGSDSEQA